MSEKSFPKQQWVGTHAGSKKIITLVSIVIGVGIVLTASAFYISSSHTQTIAPGVHIGSIDVSGNTRAQAQEKLHAYEEVLRNTGITVSYQSKSIVITPQLDAVTDPDLAREVISFDWQQTLDQAFEIGHNENFFTNALEIVTASLRQPTLEAAVTVQEDQISSIMQASFTEFETPAVDAQIEIVDGVAQITEEQAGVALQYSVAVQAIVNQLTNLMSEEVVLQETIDEPRIKKQFAGSALNSIESILENESITLVYEKGTWYLEQDVFTPWLELQLQENQVVVGINKEEIVEYLQTIAKNINVAPVNAEFELKDGKVTAFSLSQDGLTLDVEQSYEKINQQILSGDRNDIELVVAVEPASVSSATVNDLGIVQLLGQGWSDFSGSPVNRKHNISIGAGSVDGTLIAPDEEFSLLKALGTIDGEAGYRQELVIKGDRTIPEYGGGLCQVATTAFRAALKSGLPITQRRNHSYRVSYYEPPVGMDATIYDPAPDFRFLNDTGHHLLWVTRVIGTELFFEIYGTPDGRVATTTEPVVYNYKDPGEPRYVETDELPAGQKKKVESAHWGADASFTYTVTYPDGTVKEEEFHSRYVPWKETWLVGKEATTTEDEIMTVDELPEDFDIESLLQ